MNKIKKVLLIVASSLIAAGILIAIISAASVGFNRKSLGLDVAMTNSYIYEDDIANISINAATTDIYITESADNKTSILINESTKHSFNVSLTGNNLSIEAKQKGNFISFSFDNNIERKIYISLPNRVYNELKIKSANSDLTINDMRIDSLDLNIVNGKILLDDVNGKNATIETVSADVALKNVTYETSLKIKTVSGKTYGEKIDSNSIRVEGVSGDVTLVLNKNKSYDLNTVSGNINKPNGGNEDGSCYVKTVSGDISISL